MGRYSRLLKIILLISVANTQTTDAQHMVFENIGEFAGALAYTHVLMHLNLLDIQQPIHDYRA